MSNISNTRSCVGTTQQVQGIVHQALDQACTVTETEGTVIIEHPDGFEIYRALQISEFLDKWLVQYDTTQFPDAEYNPNI